MNTLPQTITMWTSIISLLIIIASLLWKLAQRLTAIDGRLTAIESDVGELKEEAKGKRGAVLESSRAGIKFSRGS